VPRGVEVDYVTLSVRRAVAPLRATRASAVPERTVGDALRCRALMGGTGCRKEAELSCELETGRERDNPTA